VYGILADTNAPSLAIIDMVAPAMGVAVSVGVGVALCAGVAVAVGVGVMVGVFVHVGPNTVTLSQTTQPDGL
jgi:hypothetical protein